MNIIPLIEYNNYVFNGAKMRKVGQYFYVVVDIVKNDGSLDTLSDNRYDNSYAAFNRVRELDEYYNKCVV